MNPISVALNGKGAFNLTRRTVRIIGSYGVTPKKMDRALQRLAAILNRFRCGATCPITTVALVRNPKLILKYQQHGIEFAIHGYRHVDYWQLSQTEQLAELTSAKQLFDQVGIPVRGVRGPYLHSNADTYAALQQLGLAYDSSQGLAWDVLDGQSTPNYERVLSFYGALPANEHPSLPSQEGSLVHIPYSLPDDEALVERLNLKTPNEMATVWLAVLRRSYELGELFTLGLHPERTFICQEPLTAVLSEAHRLNPPVWIAQLADIADWWRARSAARIELRDISHDKLQVRVTAPLGTSILARGVQVDAPTRPWAYGYHQVHATTFVVSSSLRPVIGLSLAAPPQLASFLRQQGYIVEISPTDQRYAHHVDQAAFSSAHQRALLARIEGSDRPLLRLGCWPNAARSALAVTGDIDAVTLWDYGMRFLAR